MAVKENWEVPIIARGLPPEGHQNEDSVNCITVRTEKPREAEKAWSSLWLLGYLLLLTA